MFTVLSYNKINVEQDIIEKSCRNQIAIRTNDMITFCGINSMKSMMSFFENEELLDILYYQIIDNSDVEKLYDIREKEPILPFALIVNPKISPLMYLKPKIAPKLVLFTPIDKMSFNDANSELFDVIFKDNESSNSEVCVIKNRDNTVVVPYDKITYFEACNKKINVRVGNKEIDFYDSLDNIINNLPDYFFRCHRSYIINTKKIINIKMSENIVQMYSDVFIPVSRTYKKELSNIIRKKV